MSDAFYDDENFSDEFVEADGSVDLSIWRQLLDYALVYPRDLSVLAGCAVVVALCEISFPLITKEVVDGVYEQGSDYIVAALFVHAIDHLFSDQRKGYFAQRNHNRAAREHR